MGVTISKVFPTMVTMHVFFSYKMQISVHYFLLFIPMLAVVSGINSAKMKNLESCTELRALLLFLLLWQSVLKVADRATIILEVFLRIYS